MTMVGLMVAIAAVLFACPDAKALRSSAPSLTASVPCPQASWEQAQRNIEQAEAAAKAAMLALRSADSSLIPGVANALSQLRVSVGASSNTTGHGDLQHMSAEIQKLSMLATVQASRSLSELLGAAADTQAPGSNAYNFLQGLRLCGSCHDFQRVGENHDGGYIICADGLTSGGLHGAYSYGINGYDGWGMTMAQWYHVPVFEYDCFDTRVPTPCAGCQVTFSPECIKGNHEYKVGSYNTLSDQLTHNGHAAAVDSSLLMKLDIEGGEYPIWSQEQPGTLQKFRHINTEFHWIGKEAHNAASVQAIQNLLNAGFAVVHLHGNNHAGTARFGTYSVPDVLEVTLIRQAPGTPCAGHAPQHIPQDQPCNPDVPEIPNPVLP